MVVANHLLNIKSVMLASNLESCYCHRDASGKLRSVLEPHTCGC